MPLQLTAALLNQVSDVQLNENTDTQQLEEDEYFIALIQVLEQIDMTKDVQYRVLSILRKLVHHYPNFMALEKRDLLIKLSINMIFVKQENLNFEMVNYQALQLTANQQSLINDYQLAMLGMIVDMLLQSGVGMGATPYAIIEQFKDQYGITQTHVNGIKSLLDYAMIMNQTFTSNSLDVLIACVMIHQSLKHTGDQWVFQILSIQTNNSIILRQVIETNLAGDMLM